MQMKRQNHPMFFILLMHPVERMHIKLEWDSEIVTSRANVEICTLLGYYAASNGSPLLTFWDSMLMPSSRVK
jgi:hypothetical protein